MLIIKFRSIVSVLIFFIFNSLQRQPDDDCLFKEVEEENYFHSFASHKYYNNRKHDIFIGIKTNGDIKSPRTTAPGQKAVLFIHRPVTQPTPQTQG